MSQGIELNVEPDKGPPGFTVPRDNEVPHRQLAVLEHPETHKQYMLGFHPKFIVLRSGDTGHWYLLPLAAIVAWADAKGIGGAMLVMPDGKPAPKVIVSGE